MDAKQLDSKETEEESSDFSNDSQISYDDEQEYSDDGSSSFVSEEEHHGDDKDEFRWGLTPFRTSFVRRRPRSYDDDDERENNSSNKQMPLTNDDDDDDDDEDYSKWKKHSAGPGSPEHYGLLVRRYVFRYFWKMNITTALLILSFVFWLFIQLICSDSDFTNNLRDQNTVALKERLFVRRTGGKLTPGQMAQLRQQRRKEAQKALGSAAGNGVYQSAKDGLLGLFGRREEEKKKKKKKNENVEELPKGCAAEKWHEASFPNCNDIHDIQLRDAFFSKRGKLKRDNGKPGYVADGLWRHVWSINSPTEPNQKFILKMMKAEHEVDNRNIDRHRRDALVMERLNSSPHIVSIYGYCGNTVLTEYAGRDLDDIIYDGGEDIYGRTRQTPEERLRLALDVARGIEALHSIEGGPIVHADITAKQYLVNANGNVKLNDFNRCRFVPRNVETGEQCEVKIPTAPGTYRSPEEYAYEGLTAKIDIYSVAHVLYGILTGNKAWGHYKSSQVKKMTLEGQKPPIPRELLAPNTSDSDLAALVDLAYETDPKNRISAAELVEEIQGLCKKYGVD